MKKINASSLTIMLALLIVFTVPTPTSAAIMRPSTDVTVEFKVYPDRKVEFAMNYLYNYTYPHMYYTGISAIYLEVETLKEGELTTVNTYEIVTFPEEQASQFPLNSTEISITEEYSEEILSVEIDGSLSFPRRWCGYLPYSSRYTCIDFSLFPFNSTDLTISGQYSHGVYSGTLVVHLIPGLTLGDIEINVEGNTTHLIISDSITVFYNYTLPIPDFPPLNRTMIKKISQNKTYIDQMLYQMTGGLITCEVYNITITPIDENSDKLDIKVALQGDFVDILARIYEYLIMQILYGSYYIPSDIISSISHDLANIMIKSVKEGNFELTYTSSARKVDFAINCSANLEEMWNMTAQTIVDNFPPEIQPYIEEFLEVKYASAKSYTETLTYMDGQMEHTGSYVFEGNISEELNLIKKLCIGLMNETSPYPLPWQINFIDETQIVDMSNFRFNFNETFERYMQLVSFSFEGIRVAPPINSINATHFKLTKLFNLTYSPYHEPPGINERLKIIVKGESNGTHTVIPIVDPEKVPEPDGILSGNTFVWDNQSLSGLKELIFKVYGGIAQYINEDYVSPDTPCIINAVNTANCKVIINEIETTTVVAIKNITTLPENVEPPPRTYKVLGSYVQIVPETGEEVHGNFTIKMYYDPKKLAELGIDENSLKIFYWDSNKSEWVPVETHLNSEEHYVWATVDHLSIWTVMGQAKPIWTETLFLAVISAIIIVIIAVAVFLARKRLKNR